MLNARAFARLASGLSVLGSAALGGSEINQRGHPAWFDGEKSYIIPGSAQEVSALRSLVKQVANKVPLHVKNGVFKLRAWQSDSESGFTGQGTKK